MRRAICASLILGLLAAPVVAREQVPAETRIESFSGQLPACDDGGVLGTISARFAQTESEYWSSSLTIVTFEKAAQTAFRVNGIDLAPRRYCRAVAILSDQRKHAVDYNIVEHGGIIGVGYGVEWCVQGLDRSYAYAPSCLMARP